MGQTLKVSNKGIISFSTSGRYSTALISISLHTVQPVFNRDVIAALSDSAASSLLELEAWINGEEFIGTGDAIGESAFQGGSQTTLTNQESDLIHSITHNNSSSAVPLVDQLSLYSVEEQW